MAPGHLVIVLAAGGHTLIFTFSIRPSNTRAINASSTDKHTKEKEVQDHVLEILQGSFVLCSSNDGQK